MEKKTAKYYREIFNGNDVHKAVAVLPEVLKKFGHKRWEGKDAPYEINLRKYTKFEWNHRINGFGIGKSNRVYTDIYWQGDSTDGDTSEWADVLMYGKTIPAEHEFINGRTYYRHGDLRISREEFADAIKAMGEYLSPTAIKERKEANRKAELSDKIFNLIDDMKKGLERWEMENFWNGRIAVQKLLEKEPNLLNKTFEELKPIVLKVFENNNKSNYSLRGGWYDGEKKYNLSYTK